MKWRGQSTARRNGGVVGRYAVVEPISVEPHAADLFPAYMQASDASDWTCLSAERPEDELQFRAYLTKLAASEDPLHYAIADAASGSTLGTAALMRIDCWNELGLAS